MHQQVMTAEHDIRTEAGHELLGLKEQAQSELIELTAHGVSKVTRARKGLRARFPDERLNVPTHFRALSAYPGRAARGGPS